MNVQKVKVVRTQLGTARRVLLASVAAAGNEGDDATAEQIDECEVFGTLGLMARPSNGASGAYALVVEDGDEMLVMLLQDKGLRTVSLDEGEVRLHGVNATNDASFVTIRGNGDIEIIPASGAKLYLGDAAATQKVGLGTNIAAHFSALKTAFDTHVHPETGGNTQVPTVPSPAVPDVEATDVLVRT